MSCARIYRNWHYFILFKEHSLRDGQLEAASKSICPADYYYIIIIIYYYYEMTQRQCAYRGVHLSERTVDVDVCTKTSRD